MGAIEQFWGIITDIWDTNIPYVRGFLKFALVVLFVWPLGAIIMAVISHEFALVAIPFWGMFLVAASAILAYNYPLITTIAVTVGYTRSILRDISLIIALELSIGAYFTIVHVDHDRQLAPLLVMIWFALILFSLATSTGWSKMGIFVCVIGIIVLTAVFIFGGRERLAQKISNAAAPEEEIPALFQEGGHFEDGLYIAPQNTTVKKYAKRETTVEQQEDGIKLLYNCDDNRKVADVEPYETVQITHVLKQLDMDNRCSYTYAGDSYPVYGARGQVARPKYRNDIPFPEAFPLHAVVFQLRAADGSALGQNYIPGDGRRIELVNPSNEQAELWVIYNYMSSFQNEQVGWDGSSATFNLVKIMG